MPVVVRLRSAVCLIGRFPALAGVDLDVGAGEIVLVSGANGAGKTTLLRLLAGLVAPYSGEVVVLDHDLTRDRRGGRRLVSLMGHETFCYDELTARENLCFAARAAARPAGAADAALESVGLVPSCDTLTRKLSAGQRRRLALGIALAREPQVLLLDEPHAGLDANARALVDAAVRDVASGGAAVLIASHELEHMRPLAQREVVLTRGRTVGDVIEMPAPLPVETAAADHDHVDIGPVRTP